MKTHTDERNGTVHSLLRLWGAWLGISVIVGVVLTPIMLGAYSLFLVETKSRAAFQFNADLMRPFYILWPLLVVFTAHLFFRVRAITVAVAFIFFMLAKDVVGPLGSSLFHTAVNGSWASFVGRMLSFLQFSIAGALIGTFMWLLVGRMLVSARADSPSDSAKEKDFLQMSARGALADGIWGQAFLALCLLKGAEAIAAGLRLPISQMLGARPDTAFVDFGAFADLMVYLVGWPLGFVVVLIGLIVVARWRLAQGGMMELAPVMLAGGFLGFAALLQVLQMRIYTAKVMLGRSASEVDLLDVLVEALPVISINVATAGGFWGILWFFKERKAL